MDDADRIAKLRVIMADPFDGHPPLTAEQSQAARLAARGASIAEIAVIMDVSPNTAGTYIKRVTAKTGFSKNELTRHLIKMIDQVLE